MERGVKPSELERKRAQPVGDGSQFVEGGANSSTADLEHRAERAIGFDVEERDLDVHPEGQNELLGSIVDVAFKPTAFQVTRLDDSRPRFGDPPGVNRGHRLKTLDLKGQPGRSVERGGQAGHVATAPRCAESTQAPRPHPERRC